jgi:autotransporter strand-loop-strand O-heptosyltransferase
MRILLIVPHLSTGGQPQVALKRAEALMKNNDLYFIEYREIAWSFVVQRNKIKELLGDRFISLGWTDKEQLRDHFQEVVEKINPDIIHMEEIPEMFIFGMRKEHADWLYRPDRPYKIFETTHTSTYNIENKKYFPDKFIFVSKYSQQEYSKFNIPSAVVEYPVEKLEKNKGLAIKALNWNPEYFHVLNVGLFNRDKNQGYLLEMARKLKNYKIHFHFVGNQAENFADYWKPILNGKPDNCFIYGERHDAEIFYQASDLLVHPSILELNPLAIKEATSYELPVFLNNLKTYYNTYDSYKNIKYLSMNIEKDSKMVLDNFNIQQISDNTTFEKSLIFEYLNLDNSEIKYEDIIIKEEIEEIQSNDDYCEYIIDFVNGAKVEILGKTKIQFDIEFIDKKTDIIDYKTTINTNNWSKASAQYYKDWKINIKSKGELLVEHDIDLKNKNVLVQLDSKSIGDTIAWFPYIEEFRKKHQCEMFCITHWNKWFIEEYPNVTFLNPGESVKPLYAKYSIGWFAPWDKSKNPNDYKKIPLQKTASDILGLEYKEIVPKITIPEGVRPIKEKYVCIAQYSTANAKHWHYPFINSNKGWQIIVDWLNVQGYKVMVISKQKTGLKNIIDKTGDFPIEHRINELKWCEFFIGIGSGLSWLAWAIGKKVIMISGFSSPICEFQSNNFGVHNFNVCNGCFNRHEFDRGNWNWCPEHENDVDRHFECTKNITPEMVIDRILTAKLIDNEKSFDMKKYYKSDFVLKPEMLNITYEKDKNKFNFGVKEKTTPEIHLEIRDSITKRLYHSLANVKLSKDYTVWCTFDMKPETTKVTISFFDVDKLLDVDLII